METLLYVLLTKKGEEKKERKREREMHCLLTVRAKTVGYKTQGLSTTSRRVLSKQTQHSHGIEMTPQPAASSGRPGFGS